MRRFLPLFTTVLALAAPAFAQNRPLSAAQVAQRRQAAINTYRFRALGLNAGMQPVLTNLLRDFETMQDALSREARRTRRRDGEDAPAEVATRAKGSLLDNAARLRPLIKRMRSLSPVPRALKRADDDLVDASFEFDQALNVLVVYANTPNDETELRAGRLLRRAMTSLDAGLLKMARVTEPAVRAKTYLD